MVVGTHRMYARYRSGWGGAGPAVDPRAQHCDVPVQFVILWRVLAAHIEPPVAGEVALVEHGTVGTQEAILLVVMTHPECLQKMSPFDSV